MLVDGGNGGITERNGGACMNNEELQGKEIVWWKHRRCRDACFDRQHCVSVL